VKEFTALGYETDLQFAENDIPNQLAQIENMVTKGAKALIIAAIDGSTLSDILAKAHEAGAKVFAYDRLITKTGDVDYYTTFDNFGVGVLQATSLVAGLKERFPGVKPWNVELFGGSPDDTNAFYFYDGAMSVLQPMIDSGEIVIPSGQMGMDKVGTLRWLAETAQARMDNLLSANYTDKKVNGVLAPYDGLSIGIISSLKGVGYVAGAEMPIVTGQDAEVPSVKSMMGDEQYSTVFKDTRELAKVTAKMVDAVLQGKEPEINDTKTYNNEVKIVPSYLLTPVAVGKGDIQKALVDSGYIKSEDLQ
jgi:putative multiple sugar transport system substrate-binding protein